MSFIKRGDAQPILHVIDADKDLEEKTKKALEQDAKNIEINGNKTLSKVEPTNN